MGKTTKKIITPLWQKFLTALLVVVVLLRVVTIIAPLHEKFFARGYSKQYENLKSLYLHSQYVQKIQPVIIPDETLEAYEGGAFLKGLNPILVLQDHPPLGKYFLSVSIFFFDNVNLFIIPSLLLSLLGLFLLTRLLYKNVLVAMIPVVLFAFEPIFYNQFIYTPLLEPIQLPSIIFALYFFIKGMESKKYLWWFVLASVMIGLVISIRFFILGVVLIGAMDMTMALYRKWKELVVFTCSLLLSILVLVVSYTKTMMDGSSFLHIFGIQKYMFLYHKSQIISPLSFWDLLLFNRWHTWWGDNRILHDGQWILLWPLGILATIGISAWSLWKKIKITQGEVVVCLWILLYCCLLSVGNTSTRYFIAFIPFSYIFLARLLQIVFLSVKKKFV